MSTPSGSSLANVASLFQTAQGTGVISPETAQIVNVPDMGAAIQAGIGVSVDDVPASEAVTLALLVDNSGSIGAKRKVNGVWTDNIDAVRDGVNGILDALGKSRARSGILVHIRYLSGDVICPFVPLDQAVRLTTQNYNPTGGTPLYDQTAVVVATSLAKLQEFRDAGVACRSIVCIVTDGAEAHSTEYRSPEDVRPIINDLLRTETAIVVGMGIADGSTDFEDVFTRMGIERKWVLTPDSDQKAIRLAFQLVSQSAVRASQAVGSFSQIAAGGFGS